MAMVQAEVITAWRLAADDPNPEQPANAPLVGDDFNHVMTLAENVLSGPYSDKESAKQAAIDAGGRTWFGPDAGAGETAIREKQRAGEELWDVVEFTLGITKEGLRGIRNVTGNPNPPPPQPNQYMVLCRSEEAVLQNIAADGRFDLYWIESLQDPASPDPPPPDPLPPDEVMTSAEKDHHISFQTDQMGVSEALARVLVQADDPTETRRTIANNFKAWQASLPPAAAAAALTEAGMVEGAKRMIAERKAATAPT